MHTLISNVPFKKVDIIESNCVLVAISGNYYLQFFYLQLIIYYILIINFMNNNLWKFYRK